MKYRIMLMILITGLIFSACTETEESPTPDMNVVQTIAAQTVSAMGTSVASTLQAAATEAAKVTPTVDKTETPTLTVTPSLPVITLIKPSSTAANRCDKATFVADVAAKDGSVIAPDTTFTKTWRLLNAGTCTWNSNYSMVFVGGDALSASSPVSLPKSVAPGETVDISIVMKTPTDKRTYIGYWMLQNASGGRFGIGDNADKSVWISIVVSDTTATSTVTSGTATATPSSLAVTSVSVSANPSSFSGNCGSGITVTFSASITANRSGSVSYHFAGNGGPGSVNTITFDSAGSIGVSEAVVFTGNTSGTASIYIDNPNHQTLGSASYSITCVSPTDTPVPTETPVTPSP
ncbi:MAG: hypothetical protein LWX83_16840 [Anaerolineae bacterium]|nr:hypothetical protein [Anaerolineae bacterium]